MADVVITAASVVRGSGAVVETGVAGVAITAGQTVYKDTGDADKYKLADADGVSALIRNTHGIALNNSAANQPLTVLREGPVTIGGTLTPGLVYVQSNTPGGIMPAADLSAGEFTTVLGVALSASSLGVKIFASGVSV
jgi:hypothetical protein